jgi:hypothetical protein
VVNHDNTLAGVLYYATLMEAVGESGNMAIQDPLDDLMSMASSYWLGVAQLMVSMLSLSRQDKGGGSEY